MDNEIYKKRGLILLLVVLTFVIFVGLVWVIAINPPWRQTGEPDPSNTYSILRIKKNCTYPMTYWKEHIELYPPNIVLGSIEYQAEEIQILLANEEAGPVESLQVQLLVVFMNTLSGSDQSLIEATIFQAYQWLAQHPKGSQISDSELEQGSRLHAVLEAYNLGLAGVAPCPDWILPAESVSVIVSLTATSSSTVPPSQTISPTPSQTPTPTFQPTIPIWTAIQPTQTRTPTTQAPNNPPATQAPPAPTNTVAPPTQAPPPTETEPQPTSTVPPEPTLPPPP